MSQKSLFEMLGNRVIRRELRPGDYVHHQGDFAETVSFVESGQLVVEAYPTGQFEPHPIRFVGPKGLIGEEALASSDALRATTVRTLCGVKLAVVYRDELLSAIERSTAQSQFLLRTLVAALHASHEALLAGVTGSAAQRVTRLLLHADQSLAESTGSFLFVTQHELARLAGVQRPTANRVLQDMQLAGWIELKRSRLRVLARDEMERSLADPA